MNKHGETWRIRCAELGLNPQEVKSVAGRYDMYVRFTESQGGAALPLARWYKWYRVEKLSEGHAMLTPPATGCSIGPTATPPDTVISESDFLQLLELYRPQKP
jgi:hypothetical protein